MMIPTDICDIIYNYYNPYKRDYDKVIYHLKHGNKTGTRQMFIKSQICYMISMGNRYQWTGNSGPCTIDRGYDNALGKLMDLNDICVTEGWDFYIEELERYGVKLPKRTHEHLEYGEGCIYDVDESNDKRLKREDRWQALESAGMYITFGNREEQFGAMIIK